MDAEDFAITRLEGNPAKNPSFWIHSVHIVHRYEHIGNFWLPVADRFLSEARIFGSTEVEIEYFDYVIGNGLSQDPVSGADAGMATAH